MKKYTKKIITAFIHYLIIGGIVSLTWYLVRVTAHELGFGIGKVLQEGNVTKALIYLTIFTAVWWALSDVLIKLIFWVIDFIYRRIIRQFSTAFAGGLFWGGIIALGIALLALIAAAFGGDIKGAAC